MVIKLPKDYDKIVLFHKEVLKNIKTQKARGDQKYEDQSEEIKKILEIPSNRFLDWAQSLQNFMDTTMTSKLNDYSLIMQYEKFIQDLVKYQENLSWVLDKVREVNHDYDVLTNTVLKLENKITLMKQKEAPLQNMMGELQEQNDELKKELEDKNDILEKKELELKRVKDKIWNEEISKQDFKLEEIEENDVQKEKALENTIAPNQNVSETQPVREEREEEPSPPPPSDESYENVEPLPEPESEEREEESDSVETRTPPTAQAEEETEFEKQKREQEEEDEYIKKVEEEEKSLADSPFKENEEPSESLETNTKPHKIMPEIFNTKHHNVNLEDPKEYLTLAKDTEDLTRTINELTKGENKKVDSMSLHRIRNVSIYFIEVAKIPKSQIKNLLLEAVDVQLDMINYAPKMKKTTPPRIIILLLLCMKKYDEKNFDEIFENYLSRTYKELGNQLNHRDFVRKWEETLIILEEGKIKTKYFGSAIDNISPYKKYANSKSPPYAKSLKKFKKKEEFKQKTAKKN